MEYLAGGSRWWWCGQEEFGRSGAAVARDLEPWAEAAPPDAVWVRDVHASTGFSTVRKVGGGGGRGRHPQHGGGSYHGEARQLEPVGTAEVRRTHTRHICCKSVCSYLSVFVL